MIRFRHVGCKSEIVRYVGNRPLTADSDMDSREWEWPDGSKVATCESRFVDCPDCLRSVLIHGRLLEPIDGDDPMRLLGEMADLMGAAREMTFGSDRVPLAAGIDRCGFREHYEPIGDEL